MDNSIIPICGVFHVSTFFVTIVTYRHLAFRSIEEKKASKGIFLFEQEFEKKDVVEALKSIGVSVTANMREGTLLSKAGELDEEKTSALKEALGIE